MNMKDDINLYYNNLARLPFGDNRILEEKLKEAIFNEMLPEGLVYKFISFNEDDVLNGKKIDCLKNQLLWYAAHYTLLDETEFEIKANTFEVARRTKKSQSYICNILAMYRELADVCCLTNSIRENMWQQYANAHCGVCCVFSILKYEMLNPVIYTNKAVTDFTNELTSTLNWKGNPLECMANKRLTTVPFVLKDAMLYGRELEVRLLCGDVYDSADGEMGGRIAPGKKKLLNYRGTYYNYEHSGLKLEKIILGNKLDKKYREKIKLLGVSIIEE